jgi:DNA adenine methylase
MITPRIPQPLKMHGGKYFMAKDIISLMPRHTHFVEPYAGGCAVLLAKSPHGVSEVVNDLNGSLTNFWRVLQSDSLFPLFCRQVEATPFSRDEWQRAKSHKPLPMSEEPNLEDAVRFFILCRQSLAGRNKSFTGITKTRTRRGMNNEVSAWLSAIEGLPQVHARLKRVLILNFPALDVIRTQDGDKTFYYLDPPYCHDVRTGSTEYGEYEMDRDDHLRLLTRLSRIKGKFLLSGYRNDMYDEAASRYGWKVHTFDLPNNAAGGISKRRMTECLWSNY